MTPLISVIMPVHNGARHIREALTCLFAQTHQSMEIIVVDDGSTDETVDLLSSEHASRIRLIRQQQLGHPAARNTGVRAATGSFFSFIDHDDLWPAEKTELQLQAFDAQPELDVVFGHLQNFFDDELTLEERARIVSPTHPLAGLHPGAMLVRSDSFYRVGFFSETEEMGDFLDWYGRALLLKLHTLIMPQVVMRRRIHTTNFSRSNKHLQKQYLLKLKQLLDKRRQASAQAGN
jgi:glycosyltransferase involved in cell wall biosynthesis